MTAIRRAAFAAVGPAAWAATKQPAYRGGQSGPSFLGFLDTLAAMPVAAHSINRRLTGDYGGGPFRYRDTTTQGEFEATFDVDGLTDYAAIAAQLGGHSACIVTVNDQIGSANLTQGTAAKQPAYATNVVNGKAVADFSANTKRLNCTLASGPTGNGAHCIVAVGAILSENNNALFRMIGVGDFAGSSAIEKTVNADGTVKRWGYGGGFNGGKNGTAVADTNFHRWVKRHASGTTTGRVGGADDYSGTVTYNLPALNFCWNNDGAPANDFGGAVKLAESFIFNGDITGGDQTLIEADNFYGAV